MKVELDATDYAELLRTKLLEEEACSSDVRDATSTEQQEGGRQETVFFREFCGRDLTTRELLTDLENESPLIVDMVESLVESSLRLWVLRTAKLFGANE